MTVQVCLDDKSLINVHLHKKHIQRKMLWPHRTTVGYSEDTASQQHTES